MPAPSTGRELHVDVPLSNVVVNRRPQGFIADQLLPITPVGKQSDLYYKFLYREWFGFQQGLDERAPGAEAKKVHMSVSSDTYFARNYALATDWTVEDEVNADEVLAWRQSSAIFVTDRLMTAYEMRVAALCVDTSNVGTVTTVASAWSDPVVARVFDDLTNKIDLFRQRTGKMPNTIIVPQGAWTKIKQNEQIRGRLFGQNNGGVPTLQQFASLLDIPNVLNPMAQVNTAAEFATALGSGTLSDIWGTHVWLAHINPLAGRMTDTWLNAFRWTSPLFGVPMAVQAYPFNAKRKIYEIEVSYYQAEKVVSPDLAERIVTGIT